MHYKRLHNAIPQTAGQGRALVWGICLFFAIVAGAEAADTLRTQTPPVTVEASRDSSARERIAREKLYEAGNATGGERLERVIERSTGVFVRNYGGAGAVKTISIRGASSSQTLVALNGMKLNSAQNATFDLAAFPISLLGEARLSKVGYSAEFGGNAMGGALLLTTLRPKEETYAASATAGGFSEFGASARAAFPSGKSVFSAAADWTSSKNDYPIEIAEYGERREVRRSNSDFKNVAFSISADRALELGAARATLLARSTERGSPGAVLAGNIERRKSRLKEREALLIGAWNEYLSELELRAGTLLRYSEMFFESPFGADSLVFKGNGAYYAFDAAVNLEARAEVFGNRFKVAFEPAASRLESDYMKTAAGVAERVSLGASLAAERRLARFGFGALEADAAIRLDAASGERAAPSPAATLALRDTLYEIYVRYTGNFRYPSFNEKYYLNFGNEELKPETSRNAYAGASIKIGATALSIEGYFIEGKDQIVSVAKSAHIWSAENVGRVETRGVELEAKYNLDWAFLSWSATLQEARNMTKGSAAYGKELVYVPSIISRARAAIELFGFNLDIFADYSGKRYYLADGVSSMPAYFTADVALSRSFDIFDGNLTAKIELRNAFDERYEVIRSFPMPGRAVYFTLGWKNNY